MPKIQDILSAPLPFNDVLQLIGQTADTLNLECYVIGGFVRDLLLDRPSKDIDVVVVGDGILMAKTFAKKWNKKANVSIFKTFGTAQVKYKSTEVEFVGARKESYTTDSRNPIVESGSFKDDQCRRDFTVNTLAIQLNEAHFGELIDPFNGLEDLKKQRLVTPLDPDITFSDDPLRMLRAIRFASQLQFNIDPLTFQAIRKNAERLLIIKAERIEVEFNKIMASKRPSYGILLLEECGLLSQFLPEISGLKGVEIRNGIGHKDVFYHTMKVLDNVSERSDDLYLRWSALLHDVGKPRTKAWDEKLGWTFYNHNYVGSKMTPKIFKRLKLPLGEPLKFVQKMVLLHMRPINLVDEEVSDSAIRRLLFDTGDDIDKLMDLCESDITSGNTTKVRVYTNNFKIVRQKLIELEEKDKIRNFQPPVDGNEIMQRFELPPGAIIGEFKTLITDAILDGIIPNEHDAALAYLLKLAEGKGIKEKKPLSKEPS